MAPQIPAPLYPNELRVCIKAAGYSFREVSHETGIPESTLYDWAAGNRVIPHKERKMIARLLGCSDEMLAPKPVSVVTTSTHKNHLLQYQQESSLSLLNQQGYDMDTNRRLILKAMGTVSIAFAASFQPLLDVEPWRGISQAVVKPSRLSLDTLTPFQKLTEVCWQMSNGGELLDTVEQILPTYLPQVSILAQQPSKYQGIAAGIASQGYLLSYVIASHREAFKVALDYCQKAQTYAQIAHDPNLEAAALIRQGVVGLYRKRPYQTLASYEEALQLVDTISPLTRARLYANLCEVQGKLGMEQQARRSIGLAQEHFLDETTSDPASPYIHFKASGLYLHEGLAFLDLHKSDEALDSFLHIDGLHPKLEISERARIDVLNQQALAAGSKGDLEQAYFYLQEAVTSTHKLGSDLRYSEAWDISTRVQAMYPHEAQSASFNGLFFSN